jgi:hypothetical protein
VRLLLLLTATLMASMLSAQTPAAPQASNAPAPRGNAENGKKIFTAYGCWFGVLAKTSTGTFAKSVSYPS